MHSNLKKSRNATIKAEITRFLTLTNQISDSILSYRPARDQPCLIGQRITSCGVARSLQTTAIM